jgi:hypothetical protein
MSMETLQLKKLSQAIINTKNKVKFCRIMCCEGLEEDEIDGLSLILADVVDELEQEANTVEMLKPADYAMKRKGHGLRAVMLPGAAKISSISMPNNGNEVNIPA